MLRPDRTLLLGDVVSLRFVVRPVVRSGTAPEESLDAFEIHGARSIVNINN
ncbi:MAG: hypothetical protein AB8G96_02020 [Phycisphaerales bacterium]